MTLYRLMFGFGFALLVSVSFVACNAEENAIGLSACLTQNDCADDEHCIWGVCRLSCSKKTDCPDGLYCHPDRVCTSCASQVHCPTGEFCIDGECGTVEVAEGSPLFGFDCADNTDCLSGEICSNGRCVALCDSAQDCRAPQAACSSDAVCVQCEQDADCDEGRSCAEGMCMSCTPCDEHGDCMGDAKCLPDDAAGGNRLCLSELKYCPGGTRHYGDQVCRPRALCPDLDYAAVTESCHTFDESDPKPPCGAGMLCLYNSSLSYCSVPCEADAECQRHFPGGCCGLENGGKRWCVSEAFCGE